MTEAAPALARTPLFEAHQAAGAKLVPFGGWEMPVQYAGILAEAKAVREAVGVFDVSHMGEYEVTGPDAPAFVQRVVANDVSRLAPDQALYTQFVRPDGGTVDDLLVYRVPEGYWLVVNAGNLEKDWAWLQAHRAGFDAALTDRSAETAMLAVQGPRAAGLLAGLWEGPALEGVRSFRWVDGRLAGLEVRMGRTGYTGEDGFEVFVPAGRARALWDALLAAGAAPCGLGARDALRLEAGLPLYGHELSEAISPVEAGYGWSVKTGKGDFLGREALLAHQAGQVRHRVVGLVLEGRAIAREGYPVLAGGREVGRVLSGTFSPTLGVPIATALVEPSAAEAPLSVAIRGKQSPARTVRPPFYKRS